MTTTLNIAEQLTAITGPQYLRQHEDTITVSPANTQQVSEILRFANENGITVTPTGGATKQSWGNLSKTDIRLELTRLNRVIEHPWQDLTCTVQAGCTWQQLQQALAKHGQFVALDPLWPERATVGGILATNDSGALRHRYGSLRDLVIGMTLVLADGTIARSGGKVVKNVAGYDLCKLVTGSFGTLAIITEATFRLHPLPQHVQSFTVSAPQVAQLAPLMQSIRASHLLTQALQLRGDTNGFHLDIQLNAHPEARQNEILQKMTEAAGLRLAELIGQTSQVAPEEPLASVSQIAPQRDNGLSTGLQPGEAAPDTKPGFSPGPLANAWQTRERLFAKDEAFTLKLTMPPIAVTEISDYLARCEAISVAQSLGITYAELPAPNHNSVMHIELLEDLLEKAGGALTILKEPRSLQHDLKEIMSKPTTLPLMQAVKHQFDPNRTLNPGRFLGGI
jgi:glycolate oxidase FAD binding subunit